MQLCEESLCAGEHGKQKLAIKNFERIDSITNDKLVEERIPCYAYGKMMEKNLKQCSSHAPQVTGERPEPEFFIQTGSQYLAWDIKKVPNLGMFNLQNIKCGKNITFSGETESKT